LSIDYDDRLKAHYPSIVDCLWAVYQRSIEENEGKSELKKLRYGEIFRPHPDDFFGVFVREGPDVDNCVSRPYCSAKLGDGDLEYYLFQATKDNPLEIWCQVNCFLMSSRTGEFISPGVKNQFRRFINLDGREAEDEEFYIESMMKFYEVVVLAENEGERQKTVHSFYHKLNELLDKHGGKLRTYLLGESTEGLGFSLAEMGLDEVKRWKRKLDEYIGHSALDSFVSETESLLFEEE